MENMEREEKLMERTLAAHRSGYLVDTYNMGTVKYCIVLYCTILHCIVFRSAYS